MLFMVLHHVKVFLLQMIIKDENTLRKYVQNALATAKGEPTLYEKVMPYLYESEMWVLDTFIGSGFSEYANSNEMAVIEKAIVCDAMLHAVPNLDLVLTPNGFGIVSNSNIAPASNERVKRLIEQYEKNRDIAIMLMLQFLPTHDEWLTTEQCLYFRSTLFPNLSVVKGCGKTEHLWDTYLSLREQITIAETELEEGFFGKELMDKLRMQYMTRSFSTKMHRYIAEHLRTYIIYGIQGNACPQQYLADLVNIIRNNEDDFPEWEDSNVSALFEPDVFVNKKNSTGYFF